jgi:hypothetical protein
MESPPFGPFLTAEDLPSFALPSLARTPAYQAHFHLYRKLRIVVRMRSPSRWTSSLFYRARATMSRSFPSTMLLEVYLYTLFAHTTACTLIPFRKCGSKLLGLGKACLSLRAAASTQTTHELQCRFTLQGSERGVRIDTTNLLFS